MACKTKYGFVACLAAVEAREFARRDGRGCSLGKRGALVNTISPGNIFRLLAKDQFAGLHGPGYGRTFKFSACCRVGTHGEIASVAARRPGPDDGFITGSDVLRDGGVMAAFRFNVIAQS